MKIIFKIIQLFESRVLRLTLTIGGLLYKILILIDV